MKTSEALAPQGHSQPKGKKFKKDSLWKPLVRLFRRYMKNAALDKSTYRKISLRPLKEQGKLLVEKLALPTGLAKQRDTELAVLLLVNAHSLTYHQKLTAEGREVLGASAAKLRKRYFSFFVDHNMIDRVTFFRDPLIQCLWGKFRQGYAAKILDYM